MYVYIIIINFFFFKPLDYVLILRRVSDSDESINYYIISTSRNKWQTQHHTSLHFLSVQEKNLRKSAGPSRDLTSVKYDWNL